MSIRTFQVKSCDVLIVGGGGSGALAAIEASADKALSVIVISRGPIGQSGLTPTGNGGTAGTGPPEEMFEEMVKAGRFLNDQNLVSLMANKAKGCIEKLKTLGVSVLPFRPGRVCVPGPETLRLLRKRIVQSPNIELLEDVLVTGLVNDGGRVSGAFALDLRTGDFFAVQASAVILATGGFTGELYPRSSNNPFGISTDASGTGHIMAFHAGAELIDPEMIQFVPLPAEPRNLNIRYFPDFWVGPYQNRLGKVVESDVGQYYGASYSWQVVRKLFREIKEGRGPIYIDQRTVTTPIPKGSIKPWDNRRRLIRSIGIDPREMKVELALGSHFCMGGVRVNEKTETSVPGLYAAGEIMGGLHGALRIQGHSFTQMIVFGFEAGGQAAMWARERGRPGMPSDDVIAAGKEKVFRFLQSSCKSTSVKALKARLQRVMEERVFVERDKTGLLQALSEISKIREEVLAINVPDFRRFNIEWARAIDFNFLVEAAEVAAEGALLREESRGFQYRTDFPREDNEKWLCHTVFKREHGHHVKGTLPVNLTHLKPEV